MSRVVNALFLSFVLTSAAWMGWSPSAQAQTATTTVNYDGGHCTVCGQGYACSNGHGNWNDGTRSFSDPVGVGNLVTRVQYTASAVWGCGGNTSSMTAQLNGQTVSSNSGSGQCGCGSCDPDVNFDSGNHPNGFPGYVYGGSNNVRLAFNSGLGCVARVRVTLTFGGAGPTVDALGPYSVNEGGTVQLNSSSTGNGVSLAWDFDNDGQFDDATGARPNFTAGNGPASVTVQVRATDGQNRTATDSATVNVSNVAPSVSSPGNQSSAEGQAISLQLSASDPGGDALTFSATGLPPGLSINNSGRISGTIGFDGAGTHSVTVTVSDGSLTGSTSFTWTVTNTNRAPTVTSPGNQSNAENQSISLQLSASDPDGNSLTFSATGLPPGLSINNSGQISGTIGFNGAGTHSVTVTVSDGSLTGSTSFTWTVTNTNRAPTVTNPGNQSSSEGQVINLQLSASDPDGDAVTWSATGLPPGLSVNSGTGRITGTIGFDGAGTHNVRVTASDGNLTGIADFTWTVANTNRAPSLTNPGNQSSVEGQVISLQLSATDPDNNNLTFSATGLPPGLSVNNTGRITGTIGFNGAGTHNASVTVSDGTLSANVTFTWTVGNTNQPPTVTNPGNQVNAENDTLNLQVVASDPDGDGVTFSATGLPPGLSINNTGRITGTIGFNGAGTHNASVTVSDGTLSTQVSFTWTVTNTNRAPALTSPGNQSSVEGQVIGLQLSATDPDGDGLSFSATGLPPGLSINNSGQISGTIGFDGAGTHNVRATVTDGGLSTSVTFTWTVGNTNRRPVLTNPGDQSNNENDTINLPVQATDPDGDGLSFSATGLPPGLSINNTGRISGTIGFDGAGAHTVVITVTDGTLSANVTFRWNVANTNRAPQLANLVGNQTNAENDTVNLVVATASDPDGDAVTFSATGLPPGLTINSGTGRITGTISFDAAGNYDVSVVVSDGSLTARGTLSWTVTNTNRTPIVTNPGNQTDAENDAISLQVSAVDPDGDAVTFSATGLPPGLSITAGGRINGTLTFNAEGDHAVVVRATDGSLTGTAAFTWTVRDTNRRPTVINPGDQSSAEGQAITLPISASDPDDDTLVFTAANLPPGLSINRTTGIISGSISFDAGANSPFLTTIIVDDGDLSHNVTFRWAIGETNGPPSITNPGNQTNAENQSINLQVVAVDPDGDGVTFSATGLPPGLSINNSGRISGTIGFDAAGSHAVTVEVSDGNLVSRVSFTWTVTNTNRTPVVTSPGNQTSNEAAAVNLQIVATDPDGDNLAFTATGLPPGLSIGPDNGRITGSPTFDSAGPYVVRVTVSDGTLSASVTFAWTVNNTNRQPVVTNPSDQSSAEGDTPSLRVVASDPDGDAVVFSATGLPPGLTIASNTGVISGRIDFGANDGSPFSVVVRATDGGGLIGSAAFTWTVRDTNRAPALTSPGDQSSGEGQDISLSLSATDPDGDALTYTASGLPANLTLNRTTGVISGRIDFEASDGSPYTVNILVFDGSLSASVTFRWVVTENNRAPTVSAGGPYAVDEGGVLRLSASGADLDGDALTFAWDFDGDGQFDDATGANPTFTAGDGPATVPVSVRVSDGQATASAAASISVRNVAPTIATRNIDPALPGESAVVTFSASASDPAGNADPLTFTWAFGDGSPTRVGASVTHTYRDDGTFTATLTVTDGDGGSTTQIFDVVVSAVAPLLAAIDGPVQINEGAVGRWSSALQKAIFDDVNFTIVWGDGLPNTTGAINDDLGVGLVEGTHAFRDNGTFTVEFTARDDDNQTARRTLGVTVLNVAPTILTLDGDTEGVEGGSFAYRATASDPGADTLTFTWNFGDGSDPVVGPNATHIFARNGVFTVTVTVTDEDGGSASRSLTVTVGDAAPRIVSLTGALVGDEGSALSYNAVAVDPGGDALTYTWNFGDGSQPVSGVDRTQISHVFADDGQYTLTLTVSDGQSQVSGTLTINVRNVAPTPNNLNVPDGGNEGQELTFSAGATDPGADTLTFTWDFGDGTPAQSGASVTHTYADDGFYFGLLTVRDEDGGVATRALVIGVDNVSPSIVSLNGAAVALEGGDLPYSAVATDPGDDTLTYTWNWGDNTAPDSGVDLTDVAHVYRNNGTFTLTLTVTDEDGGRVSVQRTIAIGGQAPRIDQLTGDVEGPEGGLFTFRAVASQPGNDAITYHWDFGDGSNPQSAIDLTEVEHVFAEDGLYIVTLTASDPDGEATAELALTVNNVAPSLTRVDVPQTGTEGQSLTFEAEAVDPGGLNDPLTFRWDFGDGTAPVTGASRTRAYANDGAFTVTLTVTDDEGASATTTRQITIGNAQPSIVRLLGPNGANEAQVVTFQALAADPGADALTYRWNFGDGTAAQSGVDLTEITHAFADDGAYTITLTVSDGVATTSRTLNLAVANLPPTVTALAGDVEGAEATLFSFTAAATDPAGVRDPLTFRWDFGDGSPEVVGLNLTAVDHIYQDAGRFTLRVTVTDGDGGSASRVLIVSVGNQAPVVDAFVGDTEGNEGDDFAFAITASDAGGDALTYTWTFGDGSLQESGRDLTQLTHVYRDNGRYTLRVLVSDGSDSVEHRVQITVANVSPTLVDVAVPAEGQEGVSVSFSARATDPAGDLDPLVTTWDVGDGAAPIVGASIAHTYADDGIYQVTVTVTDGDGGRTSRTVPITINNLAPAISFFDGPATIEEGVEAAFSVFATDVDDDTLGYTWRFEGGPTLSGADLTRAAHTYPDNGQFDVSVTVTDEDGGSTTRTLPLTVVNVPPSITAFTGNFTGNEGDTFAFEAEAVDQGDDVLTYTWDFGDNSAPISGVDETLVEHVYLVEGTYVLTLTVTDDDGGQTQISRTVNVGTGAPVINALTGPVKGDEGEPLAFVADADDPTDQTLTYTWNFGDGSAPASGVDLTEVTHTWADNGRFVVRMTVTDPDGNFAFSDHQVRVNNVAPSLDAFVVGAFAENIPGLASAEASDPAGIHDPLTFTWTWGDGTEPDTGVDLTEVAHTFTSNGAYLLRLTVADDDGGVVSATSRILVTDEAPRLVEIQGPSRGNEGDTLAFVADALDQGNDAVSYTWQLDDQPPVNTGRDPNFRVTFPDNGDYNLSVVATDDEGQTAVGALQITIDNVAPQGVSIVGRDQAAEGQRLTYFGTAADPAGANDPLTYTWDFGDGSDPISGIDETLVEHTYADNGIYVLRLTVADDDGGVTTRTLVVTVDNQAPEILSLVGPTSGFEGQRLSFAATATERGDDALIYTWDFGDGSQPLRGLDLTDASHTFADDGDFTLTLTVEDGDGASVSRTVELAIANLPPTIISQPPLLAIVGRPYRYTLRATDPGADDLTFALIDGPEGMALQGATLDWTMTIEQLDQGPHAVHVRVSDDDGGSADQEWLIVTNFLDVDRDGVPDDCEALFGFNPNDPTDGDEDPDGDNLNNREECLAGTDPTTFNGPTAPTLVSPEDGARLDTLTTTLIVGNASDPDGDPLTYTFELYSDADLLNPLLIVEDVAEGDETTVHDLELVLEENARHFWRARAADPFVNGPYSETGTFLIDLGNEPPSVPALVSPLRGADTLRPNLVVDPSVDPEGDAITYLFEVYSDAELAAQVAAGQTEETSFALESDLEDDTRYFWRAAARDDLGAQSDFSEPFEFVINTDNALPEAPKIIRPEDDSQVAEQPVVVTWEQAVDRDGDLLTYELELSTTADFSEIVFSQQDIPAGLDPTVSLTLPELEEDRTYSVRVRAFDFAGASPFTAVDFTVNTENTAPGSPVLISPIDGARVQQDATTLVFEAASDLDGDPLTYRVEVFRDAALTDQAFSREVEGQEGVNTVEWDDEGKATGPHFWTVTAIDPEGLEGPTAGPEGFVVDETPNLAPDAPVAISPIDGAVVDSLKDLELVIDNATDPDGDALTYTFLIFADEGRSEILWQKSDVPEGVTGQTTVAVEDLDGAGFSQFFWVAFATDARGLDGPESEMEDFRTVLSISVGTSDDCACASVASPPRTPSTHLAALMALIVGAMIIRRRRS